MKKQFILAALVVATLMQAAPQAKANSDLDHAIIGGIIGGVVGGVVADRMHDRDRRDDRWGHRPPMPPPRHRPYPPPYRPAPPPQRDQQAVVQINGITRQEGGAWYRLNLRQPLQLSGVDVRVLRANVRIHEAVLVTVRNARIPMYDLSNTSVLAAGQLVGSYVREYDRIVAIDIRAESFGDYADIGVGVSSPEGYPYIDVNRF